MNIIKAVLQEGARASQVFEANPSGSNKVCFVIAVMVAPAWVAAIGLAARLAFAVI